MCPACFSTAAAAAASAVAVGGAVTVPFRWWARLVSKVRSLFSQNSGEQR